MQELKEKLQEIKNILNSEGPVIKLNAEKQLVAGDIHGNLEALDFILKIKKNMKLILLFF